MLFRRTLKRLDKSMFAAKRRVIVPLHTTPTAPSVAVRNAFTTDPLKESDMLKMCTGGEAQRDAQDATTRLEGVSSRAGIKSSGDPDFEALIEFISGARHDQMITGRRFQKVYDRLTENDDVFIWLCMTSMAVLNPGDMKSRLVYRHLEALARAVAMNEMPQRVAFRFFESAVRSPAYRQIAERQLESGSATRLAGLCAAADVMRKMGLCRRPMQPFFELYKRISERSEALNPWGFPPLFQFEERLGLEKRLKFFGRENGKLVPEKARASKGIYFYQRYQAGTLYWVPPSWAYTSKYVGPHHQVHPGLMPD